MDEKVYPVAGIPVFQHDPYADEVMANPYPYYETMRSAGPLSWIDRYGVYVSTHDAIVRPSVADWRRFSSAQGIGPLKKKAVNELKQGATRMPASGLLEYDPPEHGPGRKVLMSLLSNRALEELKHAFSISAEVLVEEMIQRGTVDAVSELVKRYVLKVMGDAVGLPDQGRNQLLVFGELAMNVPGPVNERYNRALARVQAEGTLEWVRKMSARDALAPDGFGAQLYAFADAGEIDAEEAGGLVGVFLIAAVDSTILTLINGIHALASRPAQWRLLHSDPSQARQSFEEILRYCTAPQTLFRTTTCEVDIAGYRIPAGQKVGLSLAAANRDPARWQDPDRFDIARKPVGHMAFGGGVHACVGQMVARLEAECLLSAMARRIAKLELAGEVVPFANNAMSSYSRVPVTVTAA